MPKKANDFAFVRESKIFKVLDVGYPNKKATSVVFFCYNIPMTQSEALDILKTGANVFLTGEPGSGKTHTINEYINYLRDRQIEVAITASTGIASTHIGGMTIHSWSGIGIKNKLDKYEIDKIASSEYVSKRINKAKVLVIDEVSMLSPQTLDMVDAVCREVKNDSSAFGGLQVIFVGDFFQLPPIIKNKTENNSPQILFEDKNTGNFAYESDSWVRAKPMVCYLREQYRQDDEIFLKILSSIRTNTFDQDMFEHLEERKVHDEKASKKLLKLFSHNVDVDKVNMLELSKIEDEEEFFVMDSSGKSFIVETLKKGCLSPENLVLKVGAEVMCTKNNQKSGYVNGTLGVVVGFESGSRYPIIRTRIGKKIVIEPAEWVVEENGKKKASITQIPLRLAWAITVHKSQGMSLDEAIMDLSSVFEYGQGYVALSRVRRLSGLYLLGWNKRAFEVHPDILLSDESFKINSEQASIAFSKIPENDLKKMHDNFILASGGVLKNNIKKINKKTKNKKDTKEDTLLLWNEGKSIGEIAKIRKLKENTIFSHIEDLVSIKKIPVGNLSRLMNPVVKKSLPEIIAIFHKLDTRSLSPVFEYFKGKYSYEDIKVSRLFLEE